MAFNLRMQSIQFSKLCGVFRIPDGKRSPKLSNMQCNTPLSELFRKRMSVTFCGPTADAVRRYHVPMLMSLQFRLLFKFRSYLYFSFVVCKPYSRFSVEPNTILRKQVTIQFADKNKFRVSACDIPLCYDSIIYKFCISQNNYI
jgi:hypothetical protein